jgi:hypothetical protein
MSEETLPDIQNGLLGNINQAGDTVNAALEVLHAELTSSHGSSTGEGRNSAVHGNGLAKDASGDVLGKIDQNGSRATAGCNLESLLDPTRELGNGLNHNIPFGTGSRDTDDIGLLERIGTDRASGNLTTENNHWGTVRKSVLHRCNNIGGSWSGSNEDNTGFSRSTCVTFGHMSGTLFMARKNEVKVLRVVDGIEHGENGTTGVAN